MLKYSPLAELKYKCICVSAANMSTLTLQHVCLLHVCPIYIYIYICVLYICRLCPIYICVSYIFIYVCSIYMCVIYTCVSYIYICVSYIYVCHTCYSFIKSGNPNVCVVFRMVSNVFPFVCRCRQTLCSQECNHIAALFFIFDCTHFTRLRR